MASDNSHAPNTESVSRPSALKTLRRFCFVAWHVSPFGAIVQALLTLVHGCIPVGILWASRGLVNLIAAILANETEANLQTAAPWVIALVLLAILRNVTGTYDSYLRWKMQNRIRHYQQRLLIEAATHIDFAVFDQPQTYDLIQRARQALGHRLVNVLRFLTEIGQLCVTLLGYGVLLWIADPLLVLVVVLPALPSAWLKIKTAKSGYIHDYDATPVRRMMAYMLSLLLGSSSGQEVRLYGLFDPLAEQAVYERFIERSVGRTSVLISHRLSSVRTCDRILVLDNGSIVEDGDHETLLAQDGLYAQFFKAQAQWYV